MRFESESWKPVRGYEGLYEVSDMGRVRALFCAGNFHKPGRILKPWITRNGYIQIHLMRPGEKRKGVCIHRLMLEAFVGPRPEGCEVRHLNGQRSNNVLSNLSWGTHKQNSEDSRRLGTMAIGERAGCSKLAENDVVIIREWYGLGIPIYIIASVFEIDRTSVWQIATRKSWRHL